MEEESAEVHDRSYYASLSQSDPSFFEARKEFDVNSSDFGNAVGLGRFMTRRQFYMIKSGRSKEGEGTEDSWRNEALDYGRRSESIARGFFERTYDVEILRTGIHVIDHPYIKISSSPDGMIYHDGILVGTYETKCPFSGRTYPRPYPENLIQVQAQIQGTGLDSGFLHCWTPKNGSTVWRIERDRETWSEIVKGLEEFVTCLHMEIVPEISREYIERLTIMLERTIKFECTM